MNHETGSKNMHVGGTFDFEALDHEFKAQHSNYINAKPFAHITMDDIFSKDLLRDISNEFPQPDDMSGAFSGEIQGGKFTESDWSKFGPKTQQFVSAFNSGPFLRALTHLTGIEGLIADPYLAGGGQHQTVQGGRLKVHSDFNVHPFLNLTRRINILVYLNEDWQESWGGSLELWNRDMSKAEVSVLPSLGKVVIFSTTDESFHGLPDPISPPPGVYRRSLAFYYFTADGTTPEPRSTLWKQRPSEDFLTKLSARIKKSAGLLRQALKALATGK